MNVLQKQLVKSFLKFNVIENKPGLLRLQVGKTVEIADKYKVYEPYIISALRLLNGVESVDVSYETGVITIEYDIFNTNVSEIDKWMRVVLDTILDYYDLIKQYGETQIEQVAKKIEGVLQKKAEAFNK